MSAAAQRAATCACGQLRVTCRDEPRLVSLCHCLDCQRRTGSAFGIAAFWPRDAVSVAGRATAFSRLADSGFSIRFHFCPDCGSTVYWEPARKPDMVAVAVGAFADPGFPAPHQAVWDQRRHPWVAIQP